MEDQILGEPSYEEIADESESIEEIDYPNDTNWKISVKDEIKFWDKLKRNRLYLQT